VAELEYGAVPLTGKASGSTAKETPAVIEGGVVREGISLSHLLTHVLSPRRRQWGPDLFGTLAVLVVALALGSRLLGPNVSFPQDVVAQFQPFSTIAPMHSRNWILQDVAEVFYPNRVFVHRAFAAGQFPLWNPYILTGQPAAADPVMALFYPTTHLFGHFSAARAVNFEILLHLIIAALGVYVAVRVLGGRPLGGVVAGAAFAGCSTLTVWQQYGNLMTCGAWLPWLFVCLTMLQRGQRRIVWIGAGGLTLGLIILANDVQWLLYDLLFLAFYALWMSIDAVRTTKRHALRRPFLDSSILIDATVMVLLGFGVGAVQFLPELVLAMGGSRIGDATYASVLAQAVPPEKILALFAPNFYGTPAVLGSEWFTKGKYPETLVFWGFFSLLIAFTAPLWRSTSVIWFLWGSLVVETGMVFGTPVLHLYALLPVFNVLEVARMGYILCFIGALLTGLTLDRLFTHPRRWLPLVVLGALAVTARGALHIALPRFKPMPPLTLDPTRESLHWATIVVAAGIVFLAFGLVRVPGIRRIGAVAFAMLLVVDMLHFSLPYNAATVPESSVFPRPQAFDALHSGIVPPRAVPINAKDSHLFLPPNMLETFGISDLGADEEFVIPAYSQFIRQIEPIPFKYNGNIILLTDYTSPLFDVASAEYFLSPTPLDLTRKPLTLLASAQGMYVYHNPQAAQRAFIITDVREITLEAQAWPQLTTPGFTPCAFATVEGPSPLMRAATSAGAGCVGSAAITRYEPNRVFIHAETPTEGMLVLTDAYSPDWEVTVDGVKYPVLKADGPFRGVHIMPGDHDVRFEYHPQQLYRAGAISGVASVLCVMLVGIGLFGRKRRNAA